MRVHGKLTGLGVAAAALTAIAAAGGMTGTAHAATANPTATSAAHSAARVASVVAPAWTAPRNTLKEGDSGSAVKTLQRRLNSLKYYAGSADGKFGSDTVEAVWAFQEVQGLSVDGVVGPQTWRALEHPKSPKPRNPKVATRIEVNLGMRVLVLYHNHRIELISHVSSGGGYYFCNPGGGCAYATTPTGTYHTTVYMPGWVTVPLGKMYNPVFFIGTAYAIHGDTDVPVNPVSHGCVRVPMDIADFFHQLVKTPGTEVIVYN
ncbi:MAG TPA: L,D-transpeptidase family protein [Trebonia sp.]|nr:L,D-transpeptidase family protein [Trebonia sp.]